MATKFREGSAGAADQKMTRNFKIAMIAATILALILLWTVPLLKAEAAQTATIFKILSWIAFIMAFVFIYIEEKITDASSGPTLFYVLWFISLGLGFFLRICGGI